MTDAARRGLLPAWLWPVLLVGVLAVALLLEGLVPAGRLQTANPDRSEADAVAEAFAALPQGALVLVAMDPDLGTYPEIRGTVRAALADLLERGASLALVSYTPEGRAVAAAERERLIAAGADAGRLLDLGFVAGAEAGLVLSVTSFEPVQDEQLPAVFGPAAGGIAAFDLVLVVGGIDIGPRTWVEQVGTRVPQLPLVAVVPTFLNPETAPYVRTGQLSGLLGTVRDGAAYAALGPGEPDAPRPLAMLVGMLVALAFIGRALYGLRRGDPSGAAAEPEDEA